MAWSDLIFRWLAHGKFNTSPPTLANGDVGEFQLDSVGNLRVTVTDADAPASYREPTGIEIEAVVKVSSGHLWGIDGFNAGASLVWLFVFNATSVPGDGATSAIVRIAIPANTQFSYRPPKKKAFSTGLCFAVSTTKNVLTKAVSDGVWAAVAYT